MINQISLNIHSFSYCNFSVIITLVLEITGCGEKSLPLVYFEYLKSCSDLSFKRWTNDLPDFYFVRDKMEKQFYELSVWDKTYCRKCFERNSENK